MRSAIILAVLLVAASGLAAASPELDVLRAIETIEEKEVGRPACCNDCGRCDRRAPEFARCVCNDLVFRCHPSCRNCVRQPFLIEPPLYKCMDMSYKACHRSCATTVSKSIN